MHDLNLERLSRTDTEGLLLLIPKIIIYSILIGFKKLPNFPQIYLPSCYRTVY